MTNLNPFDAVQARAQLRAPVMPDAALAAALADKAMREADPIRAVGDLSDALLVQARALVAERLRRDLADRVPPMNNSTSAGDVRASVCMPGTYRCIETGRVGVLFLIVRGDLGKTTARVGGGPEKSSLAHFIRLV